MKLVTQVEDAELFPDFEWDFLIRHRASRGMEEIERHIAYALAVL